jgi:hypothetical protein
MVTYPNIFCKNISCNPLQKKAGFFAKKILQNCNLLHKITQLVDYFGFYGLFKLPLKKSKQALIATEYGKDYRKTFSLSPPGKDECARIIGKHEP